MSSYNPLGIYEPSKPLSARQSHQVTSYDTRALAGGRLSRDSQFDLFTQAMTMTAPESAEDTWRWMNLDNKTLARLTPNKLLELLCDLSPDISRALWDFQRMCNPGWKAEARYPNSERKHTAGQKALDEFLKTLKDLYGATDIVINRMHFAAFLRGALFGELVLDKAGRMPVDYATPDPCVVRFQKVIDEIRGPVDMPGQWINGEFVFYDRPTIRYVPIDPMPGSSYGRPLASPALFTTLFLLGMLHDLRRVVAQQGYPRLHLSINLEKLLNALPEDVQADPAKARAAVAAVIKEIQEAYSKLEPDDAYVATDVVDVKAPISAVDSRSLGAIEGLIRALERWSVRALKTMPILMGNNEAVAETHANRQWEIYIRGIKSIQHLSEQLLETHLSLGLQAQGIAAVVVFRFAEVRDAEAMRDAQVEEKRIANAARKRDEGWITQDEAAEAVVGHKAVSPTPIFRAGSATTSPEPPIEGDAKRHGNVVPFSKQKESSENSVINS